MYVKWDHFERANPILKILAASSLNLKYVLKEVWFFPKIFDSQDLQNVQGFFLKVAPFA